MSENKPKSMRQAMPTVAAWIDELREAFGADSINAAIRNGVAGGAAFYATENGQTIGSDAMPGGVEIGLRDIVLSKPDPEAGR